MPFRALDFMVVNKHLFLIILLTLLSNVSFSQVANPLRYGLVETLDGIETYSVLQNCHQDAFEKGLAISYKGIDTIRIEIPKGAKPLPLTDDVDFSGVAIIVENKNQDCSLYIKSSDVKRIPINGTNIDNGSFAHDATLGKGRNLLIVEDSDPWCARRGYSSKAYRKDMMLVVNGKASSIPVMPYCTPSSRPNAWYREIGKGKTDIRNLNFIRSANSTYQTNCIEIRNQYRLELNNIKITTPDDLEKHSDKAIHIENCYDVKLNDIIINGTYSQVNKSGYGLYLINIYKLRVSRMFGRGNWGVFGTHSLNNVILKKCDINRFDIHCYGKDIKAIGCKFSRLYNQFSSVYGTIRFEKCEFDGFIPVLIESSYNAFTPFDVVWKNCTFHLDKQHNYLLTLFGVPEAYNDRPELRRKNLPNITIKNCRVVLSDDIEKWYVVYTGGVKYKGTFDGISKISIKGLTVENNGSKEFHLFSEEVKTTLPINTIVKLKN